MTNEEFLKTFESPLGKVYFYSLTELEKRGLVALERLPYAIRVLLENALRNLGNGFVGEEDLKAVVNWGEHSDTNEIAFFPARVILQDFTGVPAVVDLAAMRSAVKRLGGDPTLVNPQIPVDLVIDHSVQVDYFGTIYSFSLNVEKEFERNKERYILLKWAQSAFKDFRVVPPGKGIIHQVNLEYLAKVVQTKPFNDGLIAYPDSLLGTDSHTTMINGLGVFGWGVGGIEAEAVMLGQPYYMILPEVIGVRLVGKLPEGATATDLVLTVTEMLRKRGVVGKFVEFFGPGIKALALPDRATIANMAPEYGATMGFFPVDEETLNYLMFTGRNPEHIGLIEKYLKEQNLFYDGGIQPGYTDILELDMEQVEPSIAGPRRPQDRIPLKKAAEVFKKTLVEFFKKSPEFHQDHHRWEEEGGIPHESAETLRKKLSGIAIIEKGEQSYVDHGSVVIAAITSCTNTSNPSVMIGAGILAKKAVERGLMTPSHVKTSLAPGSRVVVEYLQRAGLMPYLEALGFHLVGFGCTTCIGNSGPLPPAVEKAILENDLVVVSVLSGNRNFEARIHNLVKANYLASPVLVVAYALAGRIDIDLLNEPIGFDPNQNPVYLRDIWPTHREIKDALSRALSPDLFKAKYSNIFEGDENWQTLDIPKGQIYEWDPNSTYIQEPPFFINLTLDIPETRNIKGARVLALLGDSITTDHISPAGSIPRESPAGKYLIARNVKPMEFNTFGSRRGNHEVMIRGTFGNVRLRNRLVPDKEGGWTVYFPTKEVMTIYDAAVRYQKDKTPLIVIAGKEYGTGSSRDWAAKGTALLGVKAVIAESFERIHRSNLVGMGVLPLQFVDDMNASSLGLDGTEVYDILGLEPEIQPRSYATVIAKKTNEKTAEFKVLIRLDSHAEVEYYRNGGILQYVLRKMLKETKN